MGQAYIFLLGPLATVIDSSVRRQGGAEDQVQALLDNILRVTPVLGGLPDQRRGILEASAVHDPE